MTQKDKWQMTPNEKLLKITNYPKLTKNNGTYNDSKLQIMQNDKWLTLAK